MMKLRNALAMGALVIAIGVSTIGVMATEVETETEVTTMVPRFTLEEKIEILNERVASGELTQEEADEIIAAIEANSEFCKGAGRGAGRGMGARTGGCR